MNNSGKFKMTLFVVIFILLIALVIYAIVGTKEEREYYNANGVLNTLSPEIDTTPSEQPTKPVVTVPVETPSPTPQPTPTPTPEPTPEPTPNPQEVGMELAKGSFTSTDDYKLKIRADYVATVVDEEYAAVTVNVYALHYALHYNSFKTLYIELAGDGQWLDAPTINSDSATITETFMNTNTYLVKVPRGMSASLPLTVKWNFNGTYGKDAQGNSVEIPTIECGGFIQFTR